MFVTHLFASVHGVKLGQSFNIADWQGDRQDVILHEGLKNTVASVQKLWLWRVSLLVYTAEHATVI